MRHLLLLAALSPAFGGDIPTFRLYYESQTGARLNPQGLEESLGLYARVRLMDSDSILFDDTYVMVGPTLDVSPAYVQPGVGVQIMPIALFRAGARIEYSQYFGNFDQVLTWDEPAPDWSDSAVDARGAAGENVATGGLHATLDARLQAKVGPIAARYTLTARGTFMDVPEGAIVFYDATPDVAAPVDGWTLIHDTDVLYVADPQPWIVGARWTATAPLLEGSHGTNHRVGPVFVWRFPSEEGRAFAQPAVLVLTQWHVQHPWRTGQDVSQAIPYVAVAFAFHGDLLPW